MAYSRWSSDSIWYTYWLMTDKDEALGQEFCCDNGADLYRVNFFDVITDSGLETEVDYICSRTTHVEVEPDDRERLRDDLKQWRSDVIHSTKWNKE